MARRTASKSKPVAPRDPSAAAPGRLPGRPPADQATDVRDALLDAAASLFAEHGFKGTSVRLLAETSGVTPAMVSYYFGNKTGLYQALLQRTFESFLPHIGRFTEAESAEEMVDKVLELAHGSILPRPWIPQLLLREVLSDDGSFREVFAERFASRMATEVTDILSRGQDLDELRSDLDPALAYVCLVGMVIFPILGRPVLERVLGRSLDDEEFLAELRQTTRTIFFEGLHEKKDKSRSKM